jgi:hypothetical protein
MNLRRSLWCGSLLCWAVFSPLANASLLTEGFDDISTLPGAGWVLTNNSTTSGISWLQGDDTFPAGQSGGVNSYIEGGNAGGAGNISLWLLTPMLTLDNGVVLTFFTGSDQLAADNLEVRMSTNGASSDVGITDSSVGDFTTLLLAINPTQDPAGYPAPWTQFTATLSGLSGPTSGRLAFRYFVTDTSTNGAFIGIDTVNVDSGPPAPVPEPSNLTFGLVGLGLLIGFSRRVRRAL